MIEVEGIVSVGIIGAGAKGREIAAGVLLGGFRVMLEDISPARLSEAKAHITVGLDGAATRYQIDSRRRRQIGANLSTTHSIDEASRAADLLIEAAPEDPELQLEIFTIFDKFAKPHAILASTAHTVSIADLADMTNCPERCVGFRFPTPGSGDRVLRIIGAPSTAARTLQTCAGFALALRLEPEIAGEAAPVPAVREAHLS
jgi:3-hydroxyacyl-CoA dehydrogenase